MASAATTRTRAAGRAATSHRPRRSLRTLVLIVGLGIFTVWTLFPLVWIVRTSVTPNRELYQEAALIPKHLTGVHYDQVLHGTRFLTYIKNSLLVSIGTTITAMVIGVLSAYALTRLTFRGRTLMARAVIVTYLVPGSLLFIPITQVALQLHVTNKAPGLIVVYLIFTVPFCTWLAISYLNTIPVELEYAALVDGATRLQALVRVTIPLALPALAVIALFAFTNSWNEFFFALLLVTNDSQKTIPVGLSGLINGDVFQWGALMAMSLMASLPPLLVYFVAQKWVVSGLSGGAVKG